MDAFILSVDERVAALEASIAAIHYHASRSDASKATLMAIVDECEREIPELASVALGMREMLENEND